MPAVIKKCLRTSLQPLNASMPPLHYRRHFAFTTVNTLAAVLDLPILSKALAAASLLKPSPKGEGFSPRQMN
jgi:hypothetical protein